MTPDVVAAIVTAIGAVLVAVITVAIGRLRRENNEQHDAAHHDRTEMMHAITDVRDLVLKNQGKLEALHDDNAAEHERIYRVLFPDDR